MKKINKVLGWVLVLMMVTGCFGTTAFAATVNDDQTITLKIIHTNDTHSRYSYSVKNNTIGYAKLKTIINQESPDLVVDAGDIFHGQSFATIETGGSIAELMAAVGFDAIAPGNHDFNYGSARLLELGTMANTKILGNNVTDSESGNPFFSDDYLIKDIVVDGEVIRIGVFGLISPDIYSDTAPANVAGLTFGSRESVLVTARQSVAALEAQDCDVIVALTHIGDSDNGTLMRSDAIAEGAPGIDVIVDGHTHDVENREVNGTLIVQTGCYSSAVGAVEITLKKVVALAARFEVPEAENREVAPTEEIAAEETTADEAVTVELFEPEMTEEEIPAQAGGDENVSGETDVEATQALAEKSTLELTPEIQTDATEVSYLVVSKTETLTTVAQATDELIPADPTVAALTATIEAREEPIKKQVVGNTPVKLGGPTDNIWQDVRLGELNLGRALSDSYRFVTGAEIAVENAGGIRAQIPAGEINKGQVIDVLPFGNYLVTKQVTGADIKKMLETSIELGVKNQNAKDKNDNSWPGNSGSYLQWSGITAAYDLTKPAGQRVYSAKVGGVDLDPNRTYTLACNNYLATSSDYPGLQAAGVINEYSACDEAFISYLKTAGNDRFMAAINTPNVTAGTAPQPVPNPQPGQPGQKQSANNPRTGYGQWGWGFVLCR
ncbi:bifunctional metallophosphatase/5'-nucleotidase [Acetobacterium wieringae]|uniref:Bifunctional metallophosphatase/5'-nucleotidase n=1 Tax=Acetobacterium wieringae TaxID=52694 RepID=A0ABY6HCR1_9FIRM|nr:bifunctional UDP-sugar hydrolase/5'-nucleotidase [Acetobacterium wieringae]UYO61734.1 bifunctional metallophosphatase/5'-nucleotidase [Acetobacterium wieringae]VUZ28174.1 Trifunctional nucleotide phosphoesterase protein YfkN [Acetobacterium wieringae]